MVAALAYMVGAAWYHNTSVPSHFVKEVKARRADSP